MLEWKNWSGSIKFYPKKIFEPKTEQEIMDCLKLAKESNLNIRAVGSSHSSSAFLKHPTSSFL